MPDLDIFTPEPDDALAVQLGRPIDAWFETYCRRNGAATPDRYLFAEVRGFMSCVRTHSAEVVGPGPTADAAAALVGCAGMIARSVPELTLALRQAADWFGFYSPRAVRDVMLAERATFRRTMEAKRSTLIGRIVSRIDWKAFRLHPLSFPGTRMFPFGGTTAVLRISDDGSMQFGVIYRSLMCVVSEIGDDRGDWGWRDGQPTPVPEPELAL